MRINLGCGREVLEGWVNVDWNAPDVQVCHDLNRFPYPFEDESVREVRMLNCLEHLDDTCAVMRELHRILRPGGRLHIRVPYFTSIAVPSDPTHRRGFSVRTFRFFTDRAEYPLAGCAFSEYTWRLNFLETFRIQRWVNRCVSRFAHRAISKYESTGLCYLFPAWSLDVFLVK